MAQAQHTRALGTAAHGGRVDYTLLERGSDGVIQRLTQGLCAGLDGLRTLRDANGAPLLAASVVGTGCSSMNPLLAALVPGAPALAIDAIEAHLLAPWGARAEPVSACVALVATAKHTLLARVDAPGRYTPLGQTLDIAAGAVFDGLAQQWGMDLPGGATLARMADFGMAEACELPHPTLDAQSLDFRFAELRDAALERARALEGSPCEQPRADLAAAVQEAVVHQLSAQALKALRRTGLTRLSISGGVTRNDALRAALRPHCELIAPHPQAATLHSERVAMAALLRHEASEQAGHRP